MKRKRFIKIGIRNLIDKSTQREDNSMVTMRMSRRKRVLVLCTFSAGLLLLLKHTMDTETSNRKGLKWKLQLMPKYDLDTIQQLNMSIETEQRVLKVTEPPGRVKTTTTPSKITTTFLPTIQREITKECQPDFDPTHIKTPFKFYIYDLPPMYNKDIIQCMHKGYGYCYNLDYCGTGEELFRFQGNQLTYLNPEALQYSQFLRSQQTSQTDQKGGNHTSENIKSSLSYSMSIRNTHMFSLEVIIHHKLLHSPYRTLDPTQAQMFYIPFYSGLMCECDRQKAPILIRNFFNYLNTLPSFLAGKPHFSTLAKIQREQTSSDCSTLRQPESSNITFIAIEKESNPQWDSRVPYVFGKSILVAPYPAYNHFIDEIVHELKPSEYERIKDRTKFHRSVPSLAERNVFLFLGCGSRRSNGFRAQLIDQFAIQTTDDYKEYFNKQDVSIIDQIMLITNECSKKHRYTTLPWMMRSIFCLQPPGDSPTRKSFYDSILSGCIPVTFKLKDPAELPFSDKLKYEDFTYAIDEKLISEYNKTVIDIVKSIPEERVKFLHENVLGVAKWFQYSLPDGGPQYDEDAFTMILDQLRRTYKL